MAMVLVSGFILFTFLIDNVQILMCSFFLATCYLLTKMCYTLIWLPCLIGCWELIICLALPGLYWNKGNSRQTKHRCSFTLCYCVWKCPSSGVGFQFVVTTFLLLMWVFNCSLWHTLCQHTCDTIGCGLLLSFICILGGVLLYSSLNSHQCSMFALKYNWNLYVSYHSSVFYKRW